MPFSILGTKIVTTLASAIRKVFCQLPFFCAIHLLFFCSISFRTWMTSERCPIGVSSKENNICVFLPFDNSCNDFNFFCPDDPYCWIDALEDVYTQVSERKLRVANMELCIRRWRLSLSLGLPLTVGNFRQSWFLPFKMDACKTRLLFSSLGCKDPGAQELATMQLSKICSKGQTCYFALWVWQSLAVKGSSNEIPSAVPWRGSTVRNLKAMYLVALAKRRAEGLRTAVKI